jgi:hypothetical protein
MPMCIIYVSGAMSNNFRNSDKTRQNNIRYAQKIASKLWKIKNVYIICPHLNSPWATKKQFFNTGMTYNELISKDLELIEKCDCIFMLRNWKDSKGAILEHDYAGVIGIPIFYFDQIDKLEEFVSKRKTVKCHLCLTVGKIKTFKVGPKKHKLCDKCIGILNTVKESGVKETFEKYLILPKL